MKVTCQYNRWLLFSYANHHLAVKTMRNKISIQPLGFAWITKNLLNRLWKWWMDWMVWIVAFLTIVFLGHKSLFHLMKIGFSVRCFHGRFVFVTVAKPGPSKRDARAAPYNCTSSYMDMFSLVWSCKIGNTIVKCLRCSLVYHSSVLHLSSTLSLFICNLWSSKGFISFTSYKLCCKYI